MKDSNKEYLTSDEIKSYFTNPDNQPTGLFRNNFVYKKHKNISHGDIVKMFGRIDVKVIGFFRRSKIYVIYNRLDNVDSVGWNYFSNINK